MPLMTRRTAAAVTAGFVVATARASRAADYPTHPVRIIIGFGAGASADTPARLLARKFSDALGQQFVVENKAGAGSNLAAEYVAHAANDGYTIFMATSAQTNYAGMTINPTYDIVKDFVPIVRVATVPLMLVANPSLGVSNLKELIALARNSPNQIFFASSGIGTTAHVAGELINMMAGIKLVHVPYPGSAQVMTDVLTGRVQLWIAPVSAVIQQVETGKLKGIAVTTAQRAGIAPDFPTLAESGLPGYDLGLWFGLLAPAGTPKPIVDQLATIADDALKTPDLIEPLRKTGIDTVGGSPEDFARYIDAEVKKATDVAIAANIRQ
jgi:tripartite-type tricarboxylate transporter receptor subunit TctC